MHAGTIGRLREPADELLESWSRDGTLPAIEVLGTQTALDGSAVQTGQAAKRTETKTVTAGVAAGGGDTDLDVHSEPEMETVATDWIADVTGSGVVAAESVDGDGEFAFPFDIIQTQAGRLDRLTFDVTAMHRAWESEGDLHDVWMTGGDEEGARIGYHEQADVDVPPTIGLGFERSWNGTILEGVVYASGYVACYNSSTAAEFVGFVADALLPFAEVVDDGPQQQTLGASSDEETESDTTHGMPDYEPGECERCDHEREKTRDVDGETVCILCEEGVSGGSDDGE